MPKKRSNKSLHKHIHNAIVPHKGNNFKPLIFTAGGVATVLVLLFLIQAAYLFQTNVVFKHTNFLASVLPGVLATLTNQDREAAGISALTEDSHLAQAAQMKADDMAARGYFSHVDPDGHQPWYWFEKAGYEYAYAGENLAVNFTDSEDVQEAWMKSPTHHANIVKSQYTRIGIGVAQGKYQGKDTTFVVQFFATPRAQAKPAEKTIVASAAAPTAIPKAEEPAVLGVEIGTVIPDEPGEEPMLETEYEATHQATTTSEVLSFFAQVAASPTHTLIYILSGLAVLFSILILVAVMVHIKIQYLEVLGGGLLILLVTLSLLIFNATNGEDVSIPSDTQSASVMQAL